MAETPELGSFQSQTGCISIHYINDSFLDDRFTMQNQMRSSTGAWDISTLTHRRVEARAGLAKATSRR